MSQPIPVCRVWRAARGDQQAFDRLVEDMAYNMKKGAFSVWPCPHDPPCEEFKDEGVLADVTMRVLLAVADKQKLQKPNKD